MAMTAASQRIVIAIAVIALIVVAALTELLPLVPSEPPAPPDYAQPSAWLCRPGRADVCAEPVTATVFSGGGRHDVVTYAPDPKAPIDCFYVYPTVSHAPGDNAPIEATGDEIGAVRKQFARFAAVCRPFAPLYRQVTRHGLGKVFKNPDPDVPSRHIAYADVLAAWHSYLEHDNGGRGVVLVGHSQGAKILARLIAAEIDGTPLAGRLVSALLPGTRIDVPTGRDVGGTFQHVPLCATANQTGCAIAYSSYPADRAMPADAVFGSTRTPGMRYACVDPAAVAGTPTLAADLPLSGKLLETYHTDFAEVPGIISASCKTDGPFSILAIATRNDDRVGEKTAAMLDRLAEYNPTWGLHGIDLNLAEGSLVDIVRRQSAAFARR